MLSHRHRQLIIIITTKAYVDALHLTDYCYFTLCRCACVCDYAGRGCLYGRKVSEGEEEARGGAPTALTNTRYEAI
jgi:hypothetical protein